MLASPYLVEALLFDFSVRRGKADSRVVIDMLPKAIFLPVILSGMMSLRQLGLQSGSYEGRVS